MGAACTEEHLCGESRDRSKQFDTHHRRPQCLKSRVGRQSIRTAKTLTFGRLQGRPRSVQVAPRSNHQASAGACMGCPPSSGQPCPDSQPDHTVDSVRTAWQRCRAHASGSVNRTRTRTSGTAALARRWLSDYSSGSATATAPLRAFGCGLRGTGRQA
jgi:hypothetical protein